MEWLEKFLEVAVVANAYLFWQKYFQRENRDKNPKEEPDS